MLDRSTYLIKEHVGLMKLVDTYDIYDGASGEHLGVAKEEPSWMFTILRLVVEKRMLPTKVSVYPLDGGPAVLSIHRGFTFLRPKVVIHDTNQQPIGYFKGKLISLGGAFYVYDRNDQLFAEVKGDWKGWNFRFVTPSGNELGVVSRKWGGVAKELFTSADNYVVALNDSVHEKEGGNLLLLAAGLAIDTVYKER